ncbi:MAG: hypothetical protein IPL99_15520 [Candidatus Competibacteraceae bacterium]|nr:hypothetical protein [Candidatus Competibacteraceae bacterium]
MNALGVLNTIIANEDRRIANNDRDERHADAVAEGRELPDLELASHIKVEAPYSAMRRRKLGNL